MLALSALLALTLAANAAEVIKPQTNEPLRDVAVNRAPTEEGSWKEMLCADFLSNKIFKINRSGTISWEHFALHCTDVWYLPGNKIMFTNGKGVAMLDSERKQILDFNAQEETYACQPLPNGDFLAGICGAGKVLVLDSNAKQKLSVNIMPDSSQKPDHGTMRLARRLANGNFLCGLYGFDLVREYDPAGKVVWEYKTSGGAFGATRLPNGNTLIFVGDKKGSPGLIEVDPEGKTVWEFSNKDIPADFKYKQPLKFVTSCQRLPNGNTIVSNWLGHGQLGKGPHIMEITPDKKIVWIFDDHVNVKTVSAVNVIDDAKDPAKGEVFK